MLRLDGASTFLLLREEPQSYQHTIKMGIFDLNAHPGGWTFDKWVRALEHGTRSIPILRCRIMRVPFGLHRPVWVEDPDFSVAYHLRYARCPEPGDNRALCRLVSQIYAHTLEPSKPLWQAWAIDGLQDNQLAIVTMLHHAYTDGTGASRLMERYFTPEPGHGLPEPIAWPALRGVPGKLQLVLTALRDIPLSLVKALPRIVHGARELRRIRHRYAEQGVAPAPNPYRDCRDSPFNTLLSYERTFVFESLDFAGIRSTSRRFGVTINELFLAVIAEVYRRFMQERGYDPDAGPLLATIPLERRAPPEQDDMIGNQTSASYMWLPVHIEDPLERLRYAQSSSKAMKAHFAATEGADLLSIMEILPLPLFLLPDWIVKRSRKHIGPSANCLLSNVKGPVRPLWWGKLPMSNWISIGQVLQGTAINAPVWSYAGKFNLCFMADRTLLPDGWMMIERAKESFARYAGMAPRAGDPPLRDAPLDESTAR